MWSSKLPIAIFVSLAATLLVLLGVFVAPTESGSSSLTKLTAINPLKLLPDTSGKELGIQLKVFLTKAKIRRVPLAKKRSERLLTRLYKEERAVKEQMEEVAQKLGLVKTNIRRNGMRMLEIDDSQTPDDTSNRERSPRIKVSELTSAKVDEWNNDMKSLQAEHEKIRAKIDEAKSIIENPESYISIPTNYGILEPEEYRNRERDMLIKDRENMDFRRRIITGAFVPSWLEDSW